MTEEAKSRKNNQRLMVQPAGTLMLLAWPAAATGFSRCTIQGEPLLREQIAQQQK
jgi:hypothetical protein